MLKTRPKARFSQPPALRVAPQYHKAPEPFPPSTTTARGDEQNVADVPDEELPVGATESVTEIMEELVADNRDSQI